MEKYEYPELTDEVKDQIFGLNAAKLFGIDPKAKRQAIKADKLTHAPRGVPARPAPEQHAVRLGLGRRRARADDPDRELIGSTSRRVLGGPTGMRPPRAGGMGDDREDADPNPGMRPGAGGVGLGRLAGRDVEPAQPPGPDVPKGQQVQKSEEGAAPKPVPDAGNASERDEWRARAREDVASLDAYLKAKKYQLREAEFRLQVARA